MAFGSSKRYAVRVTYRDGSSRVFGPVSSRQEARNLSERTRGRDVIESRIFRWTSSDEGSGGVLAVRPAPAAPAVVIPPPPPVIDTDNVGQDNCNEPYFLGTDLDVADHAVITIDGVDYDLYNPAGPNSGLNSPGWSVLNWSATQLLFYAGGSFDGAAVTDIHLYGLGGVPDYRNTNLPFPFDIEACPPTITAQSRPACETVQVDGTFLLGVDKLEEIQYGANGPWYNPAGPNAGLNPGTVQSIIWNDNQIIINDTALATNDVAQWRMSNTVPTIIGTSIIFPAITILSCP